MAPGDIIVLSGFSLNNSASDFGIYSSSAFASPTGYAGLCSVGSWRTLDVNLLLWPKGFG